MTENQWKAFQNYKNQYKECIEKWSRYSDSLVSLIKSAAEEDTPEYLIENPVVYNTDYDKVSPQDDIKLLVVGDNPGKEEQMTKNQRFLVGQSGRIAEGFFKRNEELGVDFRKNVIILNKTPVHTAKTKHLKFLSKNGGKEISDLIIESQIKMAQITKELLNGLNDGNRACELWLVGYSELKPRGIFNEYRLKLMEDCKCWDKVFVYQHFSMNRFLVDLKSHRVENPEHTLKQSLEIIGENHRKEIFGK